MNRIERIEEQKIFIPGPLGGLEAKVSGLLKIGGKASPSSNIGVICHPHPLYQGSMDNKVVTTVIKAWQDLGFATVRFNFRGVGESEGQYGEGTGELEDLRAVLHWAQEEVPQFKVWLAGFSFGAMISIKIASQVSLQGLISIAPAVQILEQSNFQPPTCPWLIVHGEQDEVVPFGRVQTWYQSLLNEQKLDKLVTDFIAMPETTHFFHGRLNELKIHIQTFIKKWSDYL